MTAAPNPASVLGQAFTDRFAPETEPERTQFKQRLADILELQGAVVGLEITHKHMAQLAGCVVLQKEPAG